MADKSEQWFDRVFKLTGREKRLPRFPECERIILQGLLLTMQQLSQPPFPTYFRKPLPILANFFSHPSSCFSLALKTLLCFFFLVLVIPFTKTSFYPWFSDSLRIPKPLSLLFLTSLSYPNSAVPFSFKPCPTLAPFLRPFRPVLL